MPVVTSIKPQKSFGKLRTGAKRVNVYLDGKFSFGLDLENFVKLGLKVDQELSDKEIKEIIKGAEYAKTLEKLLNYTMLRPRSSKEIKDWLRRKRINITIHKKLLLRLKKLELLDDTKFAKWWIEQRLIFKKKSRKELVYELRSKGVTRNIIEDCLFGVVIDEEKIAKELIDQKSYKWKRYETSVKKQKMQSYLLGKGFGWNIVSKVIQ